MKTVLNKRPSQTLRSCLFLGRCTAQAAFPAAGSTPKGQTGVVKQRDWLAPGRTPCEGIHVLGVTDYVSITQVQQEQLSTLKQLGPRLAIPVVRTKHPGICGPQSYSKGSFSALQAPLGSTRLYFFTHPLQMAYTTIPMAHHYPLSQSNTAQCQVCHAAAYSRLWKCSTAVL